MCATVGAGLMVRALGSLVAGTATPIPQRPELSSYHGWPSEQDFVVPVDRPARWAYNFIRGVDNWGVQPEIRTGDERLRVRETLSYDPDASLDAPVLREGSRAWVRFSPGVLRISLL